MSTSRTVFRVIDSDGDIVEFDLMADGLEICDPRDDERGWYSKIPRDDALKLASWLLERFREDNGDAEEPEDGEPGGSVSEIHPK